MPMSEYYKNLRNKVGSDLIVMPSVAAVVRNEKDEILFIRKHNETLWGLPAGAIEIGETPAESVKREVYEETGLPVNPERIIGVFGGDKYKYEYDNGHKVEYLVIMFECSIVEGSLETVDGEVKELRFYQQEEAPELAIPYPKEIFNGAIPDGKSIFE